MPIATVKKNTISNFIGQALIGLIGFLFIPIYLKYLGVESYGLIGFCTTLAGVFAIFDLGVCATLNRELARLSANEESKRNIPDLLYTLERINWGAAVFIGITIMILADPIARYWINARDLPISTVRQAIYLMGVILLVQWPSNLYINGFNGLQHQTLQNVIAVTMVILRNIGVLGILIWVSPTITAFLSWYIGVYVFQVIISRWVIWRMVPQRSAAPRFQLYTLRPIWRFALGMSGITIVTMLLTQADRIILSKMISLGQFGYYSIAVAVSGALGMIVNPVFTAVSPRFAQIVAQNNLQFVTDFYHRSCQIVAVCIIPFAVILSLFSSEILMLWTSSAETTAYTHILVSTLVISTALNGLMNIPYALQLAYGWTSLTFWTNVISVLILVPTMIGLVRLWGPVGAALTLVLFNISYILICIQIMHRRLLRGQKWRWYKQDVIQPASGAILVGLVSRLLIHSSLPTFMMILSLLLTLSFSFLAAAMSAPAVRQELFKQLSLLKKTAT